MHEEKSCFSFIDAVVDEICHTIDGPYHIFKPKWHKINAYKWAEKYNYTAV